MMDDVMCKGDENSLANCDFTGWTINNCGHGEDAGVKCMVPVVSKYNLSLSGHSKRRQKLAFKTDYCLMQVESIAECSKRAFCNTFDLHQTTICL